MITEKFPHIARTVKADESVEITGDVYVGDNCKLGSNVKLETKNGRLIIGDNSIIGKSTHVWSDGKRTILGTDLQIGENCQISGSIGHGTKVGDNTVIKSTAIVGRNCIIGSDEVLEDIELPDGTTFKQQIIQQ